jgi:large subunit ribosomal protein L4
MELTVFNIEGKETSKKVALNDAIFGIEPNDHAIYLDVKQFMANQRQGTHASKERNLVAGSTKKLKRQKGSGSARYGDIKNPLFRGGGRIFGPQPRDYSFKLNKKLKKLARLSALSYKAKDQEILILEDFSMAAPKTKDFVAILKNLKVDGKKTLLILADANQHIVLSQRNLQKSKVITASSLNTYDILNAQRLLIAESSLAEIEKIHG